MFWNTLDRNKKTATTLNSSTQKSSRTGLELWAVAGILAASFGATPASAQSFIPPVTMTALTPLSTGQPNPYQVGVDKAGNVYFVSHGSTAATVSLVEIPASSPTVANPSPVVLINSIGQYNSDGVFVDSKGNLWVADGNGQPTENGSAVNVGLVEVPAGANGLPNVSTLGPTVTLTQVAATSCTGTGTVPCAWPSNSFASNITSYYSQPSGLTVSASGVVYFVDYNSGKIISFNPTSSPNTGTLLATATLKNNQASLALDGAGNVYYCDDASANYGAGGSGKLSLAAAGTLTTVGTTATNGLAMISSCIGVASDQFGNLFVSGTNTSGSQQLSEIPFENGALNFLDEFVVANTTTATASGSVTGLPTSAAFGYAGALDQYGNYYYATLSAVEQLQINTYNFGKEPVGTIITGTSTPAAATLDLYVTTAEASGTIASYYPTGSPTTNTSLAYLQSFPFSGTKSLSGGGSYVSGNNYSILMNFQPTHPGLLLGSYTPRNNGVDYAIINLRGTGVGPQALNFSAPAASQVFNQAAVSTATGAATKTLNAPQGVAIDSFGDIFVTDTGNGKVVADCLATTTQNEDGTGGNTSNSICSVTGYTGTISQLGTSFVSPAAIAIDGAESLYVVDSAATGVPVTVINGQNLTSSTLVSALATFGGTKLNSPMGIAVDGYANVYIADTGNNRIVEAHQYGATATDNIVLIPATTTFGATKLSGPQGLAVDSSANLYIADTGNNRVVEYSATGVASVISTGAITLTSPYAVAAYPSGALVVTDAKGVWLISGTASQAISLGATYTTTAIKGVTIDQYGNLFVTNTSGNQVLELATAAAPTVTFPSTNSGSSSADVNQLIFNEGNSALTDSALTLSSTNFTLDSTASTCSATSSTAAGASCTLSIKFTPSASSTGTVTGTATATTNQPVITSLGSNGSNETGVFATSSSYVVNLTGTATTTKTPQVITFAPVTTPVTYGQVTTETLSATGGGSGNAVTFSVLSGPGTVSGTNGSTLTITGAGSIVVAADQAGNSTYAAATEVTQTVVVNPAPQTITFTPLTTPITYTTTPITLSATGGASGNAVTFSVLSGPGTVSGTQLTVTGVGTIVVAADEAGNANYAAATEVTQSVVVNQATQTITFAQPTSPVVYPMTVSLTASSTSGLAITFKVISGPGTVVATSSTTATLTPTGVGSIVVAADQAGTANYTAAAEVQRTVVVNAISQLAPVNFVDGPTSTNPVVAGTYNLGHDPTIFLTDANPNAVIYYTTDGTTPTTASNQFSGQTSSKGITVSSSQTISAIAVLLGYTTSNVTSEQFIIDTGTENLTVTLSATSLTLKTGATGTITITVTPVQGINAPLTFGCSGLPTGASCTFNPNPTSTSPAQTPVTSVMTITAPTTLSEFKGYGRQLMPGVTFALMFCVVGLRKRKRFATMLLVVLGAAGLTMMSGCGSSGPSAQTSTVTISVAGDSVRVSPTFTLTVTP